VLLAIITVRKQVYLLSVYDKSDKKDISLIEIKTMIEQVKLIKVEK